MQYKKIIFLIISTVILNSSISFSQDGVIKNYRLTHKMSPAEKELMKNYSRDFTETDPPTGDIRNIAEWEPMEGVIITYDYGFGMPYSLIAKMSEDVMVTTIVSGSSQENTVRTYYQNNGVNLDNCNFMYAPIDSWWSRDYGPWFIAEDNDHVSIVDFPYNRPLRPNDDEIPVVTAAFLNIDLYGMNVTHTGGNYMCDGYGQAASTDLVWTENSQSSAQIDQKMLDYLGIENYHVRPDPLGDYIEHIDCWGKFLDVDKILIGQVPESDNRYDDFEAAADYWENETSSWGNNYQVYRVYTPGNTTPYTNSLILNNKVFVPLTGSQWDDEAIATYEAAMPGYEIIGINHSGWEDTDALHCRTHEVADREMLYIKHYPLYGEQSYQENFTIEAEVVSYGGSPVTTDFPKLFYKQNSGSWEEKIMTNTGGNTYSATIPGLGGDNEVEYYIYGENENNKSESHPLIGSADPHVFSYSGGSVDVKNIKQNKEINIFPNPNNGRFTLQTMFVSGYLQIININGQEVYSTEFSSSLNTIDISDITSGIYLIKIENEGVVYYKKIIIRQ